MIMRKRTGNMQQMLCRVTAVIMALFLLAGCAQTDTGTEQATTREITDMAGRTVEVSSDIVSVFPTDPVAAIYLYTLAPDRLLGWNYELNDTEKSMISKEYHALPVFGMGDAINYEAVIAAAPSIALVVSAINDGTKDSADELSESLGIPVVIADRELLATAESYRFLGDLLGVREQGEALAAYAEKTFDDVAAMDIAEEDKVRVYYGNGETSLNTAPAGTFSGQIIELVNAVNVAELEAADGSRVDISKEQLLAWDPDVIILNGEPKAGISGKAAADALCADPDCLSLTAVQNEAVYGIPGTPFSWVERPQGPNRVIGVRWLAGLLYPEHLAYDVDEEVKTFFDLFYHVELTDEALRHVYDE